MQCEADHKDGGVCFGRVVQGRCTREQDHWVDNDLSNLNAYGVNRKTCIHVGVFAKSEESYEGIENPTEWCPRCNREVPITEL